jgi:hypothetical protein
MGIFTPAQERIVASTFRSIDAHLAAAIRALDVADAEHSLEPHVFDIPPDKRTEIVARIAAVRALLRILLARNEVDLAPFETSTRRNATAELYGARIDLYDLRPAALRGYGALSPAAETALSEIEDRLGQRLTSVLDCLAPQPPSERRE